MAEFITGNHLVERRDSLSSTEILTDSVGVSSEDLSSSSSHKYQDGVTELETNSESDLPSVHDLLFRSSKERSDPDQNIVEGDTEKRSSDTTGVIQLKFQIHHA